MCNYSDFVEQQGVEKGLAKGREEGHLESLSESVCEPRSFGTFFH